MRPGRKGEYIEMELPDSNKEWRSEWFYIGNQEPGLPPRTGHGPKKVTEWDQQLTSREEEEISDLLADLTTLKEAGLMGGAVVINFSRRLIQPIKDRIHPAYEYWGFSDPTREVNRKVPKEEMVARVMRLLCGTIRNKTCPKAHSLLRPADLVRSCLNLYFILHRMT